MILAIDPGSTESAKLRSRLLSHVEKSETCWTWTGYKNRGYGRMWFGGGKLEYTHRISYLLFNGPIKAGLDVCHRCDNPPCVNPAHLFLGTHKQNMQDGVNKGRFRKAACKRGHLMNEENRYVSPKGAVYCRVCRRKGVRNADGH